MKQHRNNKAKLLGIFFFFIVAIAPAFTEPLQSVKTKYFEIIYREASAPSAALLKEYADGYAEEICTALQQKNQRTYTGIPLYPIRKNLMDILPGHRIAALSFTIPGLRMGHSVICPTHSYKFLP